jgi:hypothetical protein
MVRYLVRCSARKEVLVGTGEDEGGKMGGRGKGGVRGVVI